MNFKSKGVSIAFLFLVAFFWGYSFLWVDAAQEAGWSIYGLNVIKGILGVFCLLFSIKEKWWKDIKIVLLSIFIGVVLTFGYVFQAEAVKLTKISNIAMFSSLNVMIVPILAFIFFKKKLSLKIILCALLALIGIIILNISDQELSFNLGDFFAFLSVVCFSIQIVILSSKDTSEYVIGVTGLQLVTTGLVSGIIMLHKPEISHFSSDPNGLLNVAFIIIFATGLAYVLQAKFSPNVHPSLCSIILCSQSIFGAILPIIYGQEQFRLPLLIGGVIILTSVFLSVNDFGKLKRKRK